MNAARPRRLDGPTVLRAGGGGPGQGGGNRGGGTPAGPPVGRTAAVRRSGERKRQRW